MYSDGVRLQKPYQKMSTLDSDNPWIQSGHRRTIYKYYKKHVVKWNILWWPHKTQYRLQRIESLWAWNIAGSSILILLAGRIDQRTQKSASFICMWHFPHFLQSSPTWGNGTKESWIFRRYTPDGGPWIHWRPLKSAALCSIWEARPPSLSALRNRGRRAPGASSFHEVPKEIFPSLERTGKPLNFPDAACL